MIQPRVKEVILRNNVTGLLLKNRSPANRNIRLSDILGGVRLALPATCKSNQPLLDIERHGMHQASSSTSQQHFRGSES
jgi:hypothetical protein